MSGILSALLGTGGSSAVVNFTDRSVYAGSAGGTATAGYRVSTDGSDYEGVNGTYSALGTWVTPTSAGDDYEVFVTVTSGSLTTGTTGSWVATSTSPTWTRSRASFGMNTTILSMQVRLAGGGSVLDTWTVQLDAEVF